MRAGQLGDVFRESASIAHTFARAYLESRDPGNAFFAHSSIHVHVPQVGGAGPGLTWLARVFL
jgi:ATP-dependent Lon protease